MASLYIWIKQSNTNETRTKPQEENIMKNIFNDCKWAVASKIDKNTQDDRKTKVTVTALFSTPCNAEDFINNCLPAETKERFFIINIDELEACDDCDRIQKVTNLYAKVI